MVRMNDELFCNIPTVRDWPDYFEECWKWISRTTSELSIPLAVEISGMEVAWAVR